MDEAIKMLELQRDKYRAIVNSAPMHSAAWRAAVATMRATQDAIDWQRSIATPPGDG